MYRIPYKEFDIKAQYALICPNTRFTTEPIYNIFIRYYKLVTLGGPAARLWNNRHSGLPMSPQFIQISL